MSDDVLKTLRDTILDADDIPEEMLDVPEWGVTILVRGLTAAARSAMIASALDTDTGAVNLQAIYPQLVIASAYDPVTRQQIFGEGDAQRLSQKSGAATERVAMVGMRLSGFTEQSRKSLGNDSSDEANAASSSS